MEDKIWLIWMAMAGAFIIGEIFTAGFFLMWFGIGAAAAGVVALLGLGHGWQWGTFAIVSGILFVSTRKLADKMTKEQPPGIGADRFVGKTGVVLEAINNVKNTGKIRIGKEEWRADSKTEKVIPKGKTVEVTGIEGTHVIVKVIEKEK